MDEDESDEGENSYDGEEEEEDDVDNYEYGRQIEYNVGNYIGLMQPSSGWMDGNPSQVNSVTAFADDQQFVVDQCLHGFSIHRFEDVHNIVVSAVCHSPHLDLIKNATSPSRWNFDFSDALTQLRSDAVVSESVGEKRKRDELSSSAKKADVVDDDDDVVFVGFGSASLVLPHMRENCSEHVFSLTGASAENMKSCEKCFCKFLLIYSFIIIFILYHSFIIYMM
jgi:hypothetical protein